MLGEVASVGAPRAGGPAGDADVGGAQQPQGPRASPTHRPAAPRSPAPRARPRRVLPASPSPALSTAKLLLRVCLHERQ